MGVRMRHSSPTQFCPDYRAMILYVVLVVVWSLGQFLIPLGYIPVSIGVAGLIGFLIGISVELMAHNIGQPVSAVRMVSRASLYVLPLALGFGLRFGWLRFPNPWALVASTYMVVVQIGVVVYLWRTHKARLRRD